MNYVKFLMPVGWIKSENIYLPNGKAIYAEKTTIVEMDKAKKASMCPSIAYAVQCYDKILTW